MFDRLKEPLLLLQEDENLELLKQNKLNFF